MPLLDFLPYAAGVVGAAALGWWARGRHRGTDRRVLEELFMRKVRMAESDRDEAVRTLNGNLVEMRGFQARFDGYEAELNRLSEEVGGTGSALAEAQDKLAKAERGLKDVTEDRNALRTSSERALVTADEATEARDSAVVELAGAREEVARRGGELLQVALRLDELSHLERTLSQRDAALLEKDSAIRGLKERVSELSPLVEKLAKAERSLAGKDAEREASEKKLDAAWQERHDATVSELDTEVEQLKRFVAQRDAIVSERDTAIGRLEKRVTELTPFPDRLAAAESKLAGHEAERQRSEAALRSSLEERHRAELAEKRASNEELKSAVSERDARITERDAAIERLEAKIAHLSPFPARLQEADAQLAGLRSTLSERDETIETLESEVEHLSPFPGRLEHVEEQLARVEAERDRKEAALRSSLEERHGEVIGSMQATIEDLKRGVAQRDAFVSERDIAIQRLEARVEHLAPFPERLQIAEKRLAEQQSERERAEAALRSSMEERHRAELAEQRAASEELKRFVTERDAHIAERDVAVERLEEKVVELSPFPARLAESERQIAALERERVESEKRLQKSLDEQYRHVLGQKDGKIGELERALTQREQEAEQNLEQLESTWRQRHDVALREKGVESDALERRVAELERGARQQEKQREELLAAVEREKKKVEKLGEQAAELKTALDASSKELGDDKSQLAKLGASHRAVQLKLQRLQDKLDATEAELKARAERVKELEKAERDLAHELRKKNSVPIPAEDAEPDDLTQIAGIGPAAVKKLKRIGVTTYRQIALLDRDGVDELAERLGVPSARIRRERWVTSAKRQHRQAYGEKL